MTKPRVATAWLSGCSGCHMSFLDIDEGLFELADKIDLVYSPIADVKDFPQNVDVTLVEGAVTNSENEELAHTIRKNSRIVIAFGDCASTGNVSAMRNRFTVDEIERRAYIELTDRNPKVPNAYEIIATLMKKALPLHEVIPVDLFLHGCPPSAEEIWLAVTELLAGRTPVLPSAYLRFG
ncbi:MAG: NADP oxidoreductase [Desulfobulbaceae bacterium]|nr:NADP oxidoreductase [Desulfobulbaceae bacterium]